MVKFIPLELTLGLRSKVLRNDIPLDECTFNTDQVEGVFHLGYYVENEITTVATFFPNNEVDEDKFGYQLRGMATDPLFAGKGFGKQLINFAVDYIKTTNADYIWCNARSSAIKFYEKLGFEIISDEFEVSGVGPHYKMILKLNKI